MRNHFPLVEKFFRKKYNREGIEGVPEFPKDNPIPSLKLNNLFIRKRFSNRTGISQYLLEFDVATQAVIGLVLLVLITLYVIEPNLVRGIIASLRQSDSTAAVTAAEQRIRQSVAKKVYANTIPISADKIFSVPADNITLSIPGTPKREIYGFFPYWMLAHHQDISLDALTTIALFGLDVDGDGNIITATGDGQPNPGWRMWNDPTLDTLIRRAKRESVAVELTIKAFNNTDIERLSLSDEAQRKFIANAIFLIQAKSLDGINLDFEYTGTPEQSVTDGFTRLVGNLKAELTRQLPKATLTVDTYASAAALRGLHDVVALSEYADSIIIMGYDIHTPSGAAGPVAPLEGQVSILGFMQSYLEKVSPDKLILAVPYYGYDWEINNESGNNAYMLSYAEVTALGNDKAIQWDENAQTPFITYIEEGTQQSRVVHFENVRSLGTKYDLVNNKNLKGVGIWALGYDGKSTELHNLLVEKFAK